MDLVFDLPVGFRDLCFFFFFGFFGVEFGEDGEDYDLFFWFCRLRGLGICGFVGVGFEVLDFEL